jgi:asparagine synthase (glutamine-hydrolysing)
MCGLVAAFGNKATENIIQEMMNLIVHRGPDDNGVFIDSERQIALGQRRLSIQDLTAAGHQPMHSSCGRYCIVFNGEIYNHLELRKKYLNNKVFKGHSDTETIIELFAILGEKMLPELVGMWALVIWDKIDKKFLVSRDRYGQKPLYFTKVDSTLFFSSEIKPLLKLQKSVLVNEVAVTEYISTGNYEHLFENTFFKNIFIFKAACYTYISNIEARIHPIPYWKINPIKDSERVTFDEGQAKSLRSSIEEAVTSQLLSDVPVGATLSGGLDSSIIVSVMAQQLNKKFPVFTAQFPGGANDETKYVKALEKKYKGRFELIYAPVHKISLESLLEKVIFEQEEPFGDTSIIAHGFLMDEARAKGIPVILGGQGGDEVSMGYPWMAQRVASHALSKGRIGEFLTFCSTSKISKPEMLRLAFSALFPKIELEYRMKKRKSYAFLLNSDFAKTAPKSSFAPSSDFYGIFLEAIETVGIPHLTHYDDRSSMIRSIESRMPFLDHRIIEKTHVFKTGEFFKNGYSKNILRMAFKDDLPSEIIERKDKMGFYTPIREIVVSEISWIKHNINGFNLPVFNNTRINDLILKAENNMLTVNESLHIFRVLSVIIWFNRFKVEIE